MENEALLFVDEDLFFNIVRTMPDTREADDILRRAKHSCLKEQGLRLKDGDTDAVHDINAKITKINDEIHYLSRQNSDALWRQAVKEVLTAEQYENLTIRMREIRAQQIDPFYAAQNRAQAHFKHNPLHPVIEREKVAVAENLRAWI